MRAKFRIDERLRRRLRDVVLLIEIKNEEIILWTLIARLIRVIILLVIIEKEEIMLKALTDRLIARKVLFACDIHLASIVFILDDIEILWYYI